MAYKLEVVKVKSSHGARWAVKATVGNEVRCVRYRGFYYKKDAQRDIGTWEDYKDCDFLGEFKHNFDTAGALEIKEVMNVRMPEMQS